jgi:cell division protein FtsB
LSHGKRKAWKYLLIIFCILGAIAAWLGFGERGLTRLHRTEMERQAYLERIRQLNEENRALMEEANRLRDDMTYVEGVVRKDLRLVKPDEMVYRFDTEDPEDKSPTEIPLKPQENNKRGK